MHVVFFEDISILLTRLGLAVDLPLNTVLLSIRLPPGSSPARFRSSLSFGPVRDETL